MISKSVKYFCCEDPSLIENYDKAIIDKNQTWIIHHRLEIQENNILISRQELINQGLYYNRPASELIFLTKSEHSKLHGKDNKYRLGHPFTEESKLKISNTTKKKYEDPNFKQFMKEKVWQNPERIRKVKEKLKGKPLSKQNKENLSKSMKGRYDGEKNPFYGKHHTEENRKKCGIKNKGRHRYTNGIINIFRYECPEGFWPGYTKFK